MKKGNKTANNKKTKFIVVCLECKSKLRRAKQKPLFDINAHMCSLFCFFPYRRSLVCSRNACLPLRIIFSRMASSGQMESYSRTASSNMLTSSF